MGMEGWVGVGVGGCTAQYLAQVHLGTVTCYVLTCYVLHRVLWYIKCTKCIGVSVSGRMYLPVVHVTRMSCVQ